MSRIDKTEIAKLTNGSYVYGEYDEIEKHCKQHKVSVDFYHNHVSPAICRANF